MNNSTMKIRDTASSHTDTRRLSMKNRIKIMVTSALLLVASSAMAEIVFLPTSGMYTNPELVPVNIQHLDDSIIRVHTNGLTGELTIKGSNVSSSGDDNFPPEYDVPATAKGTLPFNQQLELVINLSLGVVEGRASGQIFTSNENSFVIDGNNDASTEIIRYHADVRGNAICLPLNGRDCGQLVVDLELQGVLSDPNNPSVVGRLCTAMLGSLVVNDVNLGIWAAMSANITIGGTQALISSLTSMGEDEMRVEHGRTEHEEEIDVHGIFWNTPGRVDSALAHARCQGALI